MSTRTEQHAFADALRSHINGIVLTSGDAGYDAARTPFFSHRIGHPTAVVRPKHAADVAAVIDMANRTGTALFVRSGGHSWYSTGDGVLLDLGSLTDLELDLSSGTALAETGLTANDVTQMLASHGLAVGFGDTGSVGIGGITLGGGIGFLSRLHGMTIDHVLAAEIVTANGQFRTIDAEHEPDLFWAILGGGGNFGVVTRFQYGVVRVPEIYGGLLVLPATVRTISELAAACVEADERLTVIANIMLAPPMPFLPPHIAGTLVVLARVCCAGPAGADAVRSLRELTTPIADLLQPMPYGALFAEEAPDRGQRPAIKTMFIDHLDAGVAANMLDHLRRASSWLRLVQFRVLGGAISRVPADATAYAHRNSKILVNMVHGAEADAAAANRWTREVARDLYQGDGGAYVNFLGPDDTHQVESAYPGQTLKKLRRIKAAYDPTNLFRNNVNIIPA
jgi:FAD binding domain/Berberine and berberine like